MKLDLVPILSIPMDERFEYLRKNKETLINTKKSTPHTWDAKDSIMSYGYLEKASGLSRLLKTANVVIFETDIKKSYNQKMFEMYNSMSVDQHSIGLQYVQMELALNDPSDKDHYKTWSSYIDMAMNKEKAVENGFFFVVKEYKLIENSAVLFGANELTPTLEVKIIDENTSRVKVVANTANWIDEQMDLLIPGAPKKSISERKKMIPHLQDHVHTTASKLGEVVDIYEQVIDLNKFIKAAFESTSQKSEPLEALDLDYIVKNLKL